LSVSQPVFRSNKAFFRSLTLFAALLILLWLGFYALWSLAHLSVDLVS
jgi:hypothetical protein